MTNHKLKKLVEAASLISQTADLYEKMMGVDPVVIKEARETSITWRQQVASSLDDYDQADPEIRGDGNEHSKGSEQSMDGDEESDFSEGTDEEGGVSALNLE